MISQGGFFGATSSDRPLIYRGDDDDNGVYIEWDRSGLANVATYNILRADQFDGEYTQIGSVTFPENNYVDEDGNSYQFYRVQEMASDGVTQISMSAPFIGEELLVKANLSIQMRELIRVPIYDEEAIFDRRSRSVAHFSFNDWNYWPRPEIRINGATEGGTLDPWQPLDEVNAITTTLASGQTADYPGGLRYKLDYQGGVFFIDGSTNEVPTPLQVYNSIRGKYSVRLFTCREMNDAMYMALQDINAQPGTTKFRSLSQVPYWYDGALVTGATYKLLRKLQLSLNSQQYNMVINDPENKNGDTRLADSIREFKEDWQNMLKTLPKSRYPKTLYVTQPEVYLPGGRSRYFRQLFKDEG